MTCDELVKWAKTQEGRVTYNELVEWAKTQDITEEEIIRWYALSDVQSIRDMTDREMIDFLVGGVKYDSAHVKEHWEALDEKTQADYKTYMIDYLKGDVSAKED